MGFLWCISFHTSSLKKLMVGEGRRNSKTMKSHQLKQLHKYDKGVSEPLGQFHLDLIPPTCMYSIT
jgi:hypothetical protein